jgi:hypothetical protein
VRRAIMTRREGRKPQLLKPLRYSWKGCFNALAWRPQAG